MEGLEFYMFEDELWCKTSDGKNFIVDESHTELVKYILIYANISKIFSQI